jgi:CDP-diacylglycerol--glycerol-3-phosphate 3-phosphatidyltransferase
MVNAHTQNMTLADKITSIRLVLAPVFFVIYLLPRFFPSYTEIFSLSGAGTVCTEPFLWVLFIGSEITDMLDGLVARKRGEVSDFGKLFDPFADTLTQMTYFLCFVVDGIFSPLLFLVMLYREFGILFIRNLMLKKGLVLGARMSGKIKTVSYVIAGSLALLASTAVRLGFCSDACRWLALAAQVVFAFSVAIAVYSFFEYVFVYSKTPKGDEKSEINP